MSDKDEVTELLGLLTEMKQYIEYCEVAHDGEYGLNRDYGELLMEGKMPSIYHKVLRLLESNWVKSVSDERDAWRNSFGHLMAQIEAMRERAQKYGEEEHEMRNYESAEHHWKTCGTLKELLRLGDCFRPENIGTVSIEEVNRVELSTEEGCVSRAEQPGT